MAKTFVDLDSWKSSIILVKNIYSLTKDFPKDELFGITNQMRRAVISIPSNIAEGWSRNSPKEFIRYINISLGSLSELHCQLIISKELSYITTENFNHCLSIIEEIGRLLGGLKKYLCQKLDDQSPVTSHQSPS